MNTNKTQTPEHSKNKPHKLNQLAYRDGYIHGGVGERQNSENKSHYSPKNSASNGLIFGITIATIATLISGALFLLMHHHQPSTESVKTISVPKNSQSQNP